MFLFKRDELDVIVTGHNVPELQVGDRNGSHAITGYFLGHVS